MDTDHESSRRSSAKRPRTEAAAAFGTIPVPAEAEAEAEVEAPTSTVSGSLPMSTQQSIESLLSIPVAVVFRTCSSQKGRPLLTRAEAECFLRISFLAQEIDTLVGSSESLFLQQQYYSQYTRDLLSSSLSSSSQPSSSSQNSHAPSENQNTTRTQTVYPLNPMLRPLLPILNFLQEKSAPTLQRIHQTLSHLSAELIGCSSILRQSAEQNWTMADALDAMQQDSTEEGPALSDEKRKVADLEEELCQRIERVVGMSQVEGESSSAKLSQSSQDNRYRRKLFGENDDQQFDTEGGPQGNGGEKDHSEQDHSDNTSNDGKDGVDQQYALDLKPILEYCSELFDDVLQTGGSQEESIDDENGDGANSNENGTDERMHVDESSSQGERGETSRNGNVGEQSSENDGNASQDDGVAESGGNGEMEVDPVETRAESSQTRNNISTDMRHEVENDDNHIAATEDSNTGHENHEQGTMEIENALPESISSNAMVDAKEAATTVDEEVEEYPPSQETDLQSGRSRERSQGNSFSLQNNIPSPNENEKHPAVLLPPITTQPEGSSFPLTAEDDIEEDDDDEDVDDDDDDDRSQRPMCSQRTSSAAEALAILGNVSRFPTKDVSLF
ncbi:unnamed protein product [Cylindrotheca closterium]|uniref:Uncharacterized protein n=1 Tax=Cylindrotheca closterium TaxID=2856 RepID=A0AAD2FGP5_9STRA|nr:unnamed protein product [Cylindrotheca closterium]